MKPNCTKLVNKKHTFFEQAGILVSLFSFLLLVSCSDQDPVVAHVEDKELRESEALAIMDFLGYNSKDKVEFSNFLEDWCEQTLYLIELERNYPDNNILVQLRAQRYQADLAKNELENLKIEEKTDTVVSKEQIENYYNNHKDEFVLTDYLVRALYLKIPSTADYKKKDIQSKYLLKKNKDLDEVNSYAKLYAENFYFNDSSWIYFSELTKDIPMKRFNKDNIVLNRTKTYFTEGDFTYFLNIIDFQLKDEAPPIDFLQDEIKAIILAGRYQDSKEKVAPSILKELKKKYEFEINH
jgi:hypothetical protein